VREGALLVARLVRLVGEHVAVLFVVLAPELVDEVGGDVVGGVVADHADHEDAVRLQVEGEEVVEALGHQLLVDVVVEEVGPLGDPLARAGGHSERRIKAKSKHLRGKRPLGVLVP